MLKIQSTTKKKNPKEKTVTITTDVVACTSFRVGVTTLRISARTSLRKRVSPFQAPIALPEILLTARPFLELGGTLFALLDCCFGCHTSIPSRPAFVAGRSLI